MQSPSVGRPMRINLPENFPESGKGVKNRLTFLYSTKFAEIQQCLPFFRAGFAKSFTNFQVLGAA